MKQHSRRSAAMATLVGTGATVAITVGQAFILIPLALAHVGTQVYGAWLAASELLVWVQLFDLGVPNLLTQRIGAAAGRKDTDLTARWASTGLAGLVVVAVLFSALAVWTAPLVTRWAQVPDSTADDFTSSFRLGATASALLLLSNGVVGISRGLQMTAVVNAAQVLGAFTGLAVTIGFLLTGGGIWSFPLGLVGRALVSAGGAAVFLIRARAHAGLRLGLPSRAILRETAILAPSMVTASAGYLVANNTELVLVATLFGPVTTAVYTLTRRACDACRSLLDSIAWAVSGGFAHLVTAHDRHRARGILREILWLRVGAASICGAIILAVNEAFVSLLFGPENFGGMWLTLAFAVQMIVGGQTFLSNYLLRAAGRVREGSYLLGAEAALRLCAMIAGLLAFGPVGGPAAAALASLVLLAITLRYLNRDLPHCDDPLSSPGTAAHLAPAAVLGIGIVSSVVAELRSWPHLVLAATITLALASGVFWVLAPPLLGGSVFRWKRS